MLLRRPLALMLSAALLATCATLLFLNKFIVALLFVGAALAGAAVARLLSSNSRDSLTALPGGGSSSLPSSPLATALPSLTTTKHALTVASTNKAASDNLVMVSALLEATMDSMREGVLVLDSEMRVVAANAAAVNIFASAESQESQLLSKRLSALTRNSSVHAAFQTALEKGERAEVTVETVAHERRIFDLRVAPLRSSGHAEASSEIKGAVGVFFDITRLERLERVRQEFLSNVSHELRTPLTAILTFVETLEEGAIDDPQNNRPFLSIIRRNATRMHNLIDDILELSAIEAGNVQVEPTHVRLHAMVNDVLTAVEARAVARSIEMRNEVAAEAIVYADPRRLEQMLTNLVDNAVKFNHEAGSITIHYEQQARDRISITDTGEGIAPEHLGRIFERFYRVDRARSRALGGTGLGLAIVKHLARAHGGEALVRSTSGQGSTFIIELPIHQQPESASCDNLNQPAATSLEEQAIAVESQTSGEAAR